MAHVHGWTGVRWRRRAARRRGVPGRRRPFRPPPGCAKRSATACWRSATTSCTVNKKKLAKSSKIKARVETRPFIRKRNEVNRKEKTKTQENSVPQPLYRIKPGSRTMEKLNWDEICKNWFVSNENGWTTRRSSTNCYLKTGREVGIRKVIVGCMGGLASKSLRWTTRESKVNQPPTTSCWRCQPLKKLKQKRGPNSKRSNKYI